MSGIINKKYIWWPIVGILFVTSLAFSPSLNSRFVSWDDDVHLLNNPSLHPLDIKHIGEIFSTTVNKTYIPLTSLSFALEYHFFKDNPFIYHLNNLLLHLAVTVMVLFFSLRLGLSLRASVTAALIFGVHPIHVESVAWVTERKDVLYAFFYMLALLCYCRYLKVVLNPSSRGDGQRVFILTIIFGFLSILTKPMALSLPLMLFACDWFLGRRLTVRSFLEKVRCGLAVFPIAWMTYALQMRSWDSNFFQSMLMWIWCFVFYIKKLFYPDYFVLIYKRSLPVSIANLDYLFSIVLFAFFVALVVFLRKNRLFLWANLFYFVSIFFLLRFDDKADFNMVGDRFVYLGMAGWCMLMGVCYEKLHLRFQERKYARIFIKSVGFMVLGLLSLQTFRQCFIWRDGVSLWEHQLTYQRRAVPALTYAKLARAYVERGDYQNDVKKVDKIIRYYQTALLIKPDYANAYYGLGDFYLRLGEEQSAKESFERAVQRNAEHFEAYYQLGRLYYRQGTYPKAVEAFTRAMNIMPENEELYSRIMRFYKEERQRRDR